MKTTAVDKSAHKDVEIFYEGHMYKYSTGSICLCTENSSRYFKGVIIHKQGAYDVGEVITDTPSGITEFHGVVTLED